MRGLLTVSGVLQAADGGAHGAHPPQDRPGACAGQPLRERERERDREREGKGGVKERERERERERDREGEMERERAAQQGGHNLDAFNDFRAENGSRQKLNLALTVVFVLSSPGRKPCNVKYSRPKIIQPKSLSSKNLRTRKLPPKLLHLPLKPLPPPLKPLHPLPRPCTPLSSPCTTLFLGASQYSVCLYSSSPLILSACVGPHLRVHLHGAI